MLDEGVREGYMIPGRELLKSLVILELQASTPLILIISIFLVYFYP